MCLAVEISLLPDLPFPGLLIPHTTWLEDQAHIIQSLVQT
jgi:hypothetical protein